MSDKSVIIIGAGLAGLSAGCFGRMNGCATRIFEHRSVPGGVAAAWTRGDYLIDGGIHFLMSWKPGNPVHDLYRTLGVFDSNRVIEMKTYMSFVDQKGNSPLQVTNDLDRLASDLKSISPADSVHIDEFINAAKAMRGFDMGASMADPPELAGLWGSLKQTWQMRSLIKFVTGKFGKSVAEYTSSTTSFSLKFPSGLFSGCLRRLPTVSSAWSKAARSIS
jgi:phytoene dehydrogenase-like protein